MSDIYQTVTDRIIAMLERGTEAWRCPWHNRAGEAASIMMPQNVTGRQYRGINVPLLWATADAFGYQSGTWATYKQWQERGAQVRKGEDETSERLMARGYFVFNQFKDGISYYSTLGHEHVHWTGHKARCDREFGRRFGDQAYAFEELVAELGAAFLCAELNLTNEPRGDHAAYLASWLGVLKSDKRAIFTAASKAQAAVDHLKGLQQLELAIAA